MPCTLYHLAQSTFIRSYTTAFVSPVSVRLTKAFVYFSKQHGFHGSPQLDAQNNEIFLHVNRFHFSGSGLVTFLMTFVPFYEFTQFVCVCVYVVVTFREV